MEAILMIIKFLFAAFAFLGWGLGNAAQFGLRLVGRRSDRLARSLTSTKEEYVGDWLVYAGVIVLWLIAVAVTFAFQRSTRLGWVTLSLVIAAGLAVLWLFTRTRFLRTLLGILAFVVLLADVGAIVAVGINHGALIAMGLLVLQIAVALAIVRIVSRSAFEAWLMVLGFFLLVAAPVGVAFGIQLLDESVGRPFSLPVLALGLVVTGMAIPYSWPDPYVAGFVGAFAILWASFLGSVAFYLSPAIGWGAIGILAASLSAAIVLAIRLRPPGSPDDGASADASALAPAPTD